MSQKTQQNKKEKEEENACRDCMAASTSLYPVCPNMCPFLRVRTKLDSQEEE